MRLLIHETSFRRLQAELAAQGPAVEPLVVSDEGAITADGRTLAPEDARPEAGWANADVFFGGAGREFMVTLLKSPDLKWVQSGAAGFDNPVFGKLAAKGARLTTSHGQAVGMSEYVLAGVLAHLQRIPERRAAQAAHEWKRLPFREIMGSHWLIVGFGAIGQGVAERARAFGATITGVRRSQAPHPAADRIAALPDLRDLLPTADVVVLATPLTPQTKALADAGFFAAMKEGSVFVNVGRGGLVDEAALLAALDRGVPEHAVLDVFETEPLPPDSPFWDHPRVSLTPHSSGMTAGQGARNDRLFLENLSRYLAGEPLLNEADPKDVIAG